MRARRWISFRDADGGIDVYAQVFLLPLSISVHQAGGKFTTEKDLSNAWRAGGAPEGYATRLKRAKGEEYGSSILHFCMLYGIPRKPVASYCFAVI